MARDTKNSFWDKKRAKSRNLILRTKKQILILWTKMQNEFAKFDFGHKNHTLCLLLRLLQLMVAQRVCTKKFGGKPRIDEFFDLQHDACYCTWPWPGVETAMTEHIM